MFLVLVFSSLNVTYLRQAGVAFAFARRSGGLKEFAGSVKVTQKIENLMQLVIGLLIKFGQPGAHAPWQLLRPPFLEPLCVAVVALQRQVPIIVSSSVFRASGKRVRCNQVRTVHCPDVLFRPCFKGTLWTAIFCRSGSRRQFPSSSFPLLVILYMRSYPPWSWGEQSNMCFEVTMKRALMALVRAQEETLDSIHCN